MTSASIWQISFGLILVLVMLAAALGAKRAFSIGALLVLIPFQTIDTRYGSSSVLIAYALAGVLLISGGLKPRMLGAIGLIVLAYCTSLALADRDMFMRHVLYMFQLFSSLVVFLLAYNYALLVKNERSVMSVLLAINALAVVYCALQLTVGPGESFVPLGVDEFKFNLNRHPGDPRLVGPFDAPGSTAGYFALMTLVCAVEFMFSKGRRRVLVCLLIVCNVLGLVATGNRTGFLVLLAMSPILMFSYRRDLGTATVLRYCVGGAALLAVVAAATVTLTDFDQMFLRLETVTQTEEGVPLTREAAWPVAIEKIKRDPWLGEGPYFWTAEDAEKINQLQVEFDELGTLDTAFDQYPHSLYLFLLRTVGIIGLVVVVGFFLRVWHVLFQELRKNDAIIYRRAIIRLGLFLIPAFLIAQITLEFIRPTTMDYAQFIFALMGLLVGTSDRSKLAASKATSLERQKVAGHNMHHGRESIVA